MSANARLVLVEKTVERTSVNRTRVRPMERVLWTFRRWTDFIVHATKAGLASLATKTYVIRCPVRTAARAAGAQRVTTSAHVQ